MEKYAADATEASVADHSRDAVAISERWGDVMRAKVNELVDLVDCGPEGIRGNHDDMQDWTNGVIALSGEITVIAETIKFLDQVVEWTRCPNCGYQMGGRR